MKATKARMPIKQSFYTVIYYLNVYQTKYQFLHRKYITSLKIFRKILYLNQWFNCFKDY